MGRVIHRLEVVVKLAFHLKRLRRARGAGKSKGIVFVDMPAQVAGHIGVGSAGKANGQMSVDSKRPQDKGAENALAQVNAHIAVRQLEGADELRDIQFSLPGTASRSPVLVAAEARGRHTG